MTETMRDVVVEALKEVAPEVDTATLEPDAEFAYELDLDSMDHLNVMMAIGQRTGIEIPERDYGKLTTLAAAVAYLEAARV